MEQRLLADRVATPIGAFIIVAEATGGLCAAEFADHEDRLQRSLRLRYGPAGFSLSPVKDPVGAATAISAYFAGDVGAIDALEVTAGGTPFQRRVWQALRGIPCGAPTTYGALARTIGHPTAVRAVGHANGANPVSIVVPCHRLIGSTGALTGYGGGIERKRWLLDHEARAAQAS